MSNLGLVIQLMVIRHVLLQHLNQFAARILTNLQFGRKHNGLLVAGRALRTGPRFTAIGSPAGAFSQGNASCRHYRYSSADERWVDSRSYSRNQNHPPCQAAEPQAHKLREGRRQPSPNRRTIRTARPSAAPKFFFHVEASAVKRKGIGTTFWVPR